MTDYFADVDPVLAALRCACGSAFPVVVRNEATLLLLTARHGGHKQSQAVAILLKGPRGLEPPP